jgi:hypothetical protein
VTSELIRHAVAEDLRPHPAVCAIVPEPTLDVVWETGAHARIEQPPAELAETSLATLTFDRLITQLVCEVDREIMHEELDAFRWLTLCCDRHGEVQAVKDTAVVEKTLAVGSPSGSVTGCCTAGGQSPGGRRGVACGLTPRPGS